MPVPTRVAVSALALAGLAAAIAPASAYTPVTPLQATYAHCGTAAKAIAMGTTTYAMNTTKPTTSFTANGGCGTLDTTKRDDDGILLTGTYTGNLDRLTVDAHVIDAGPVRVGAFAEVYVDAEVTIDGETVATGELHLAPIASSTGASRLLQFSVRDIGLLGPAEAGQHEVKIKLNTSAYVDGDEVAWVADATEVQTGVTYSPAQLAGVVLAVPPAEEE